jgi:hypothetical protein
MSELVQEYETTGGERLRRRRRREGDRLVYEPIECGVTHFCSEVEHGSFLILEAKYSFLPQFSIYLRPSHH